MNLRSFISGLFLLACVAYCIGELGCGGDDDYEAKLTYPTDGTTFEQGWIDHEAHYTPAAGGVRLESSGPSGEYRKQEASGGSYSVFARPLNLIELGDWDSNAWGAWKKVNGDTATAESSGAGIFIVQRYSPKPTLRQLQQQSKSNGERVGRTVHFSENATKQEILEAIDILPKGYLRKNLDYENHQRQKFGDLLVNLAIQKHLPNLSLGDLDALRRKAMRRAYGMEKPFKLGENYPEPFNPSTSIPYSVTGDQSRRVALNVFNLNGQRIRNLVNRVQTPGEYLASWDGKNHTGKIVSSGVYFYQLEMSGISEVKKMLFVK